MMFVRDLVVQLDLSQGDAWDRIRPYWPIWVPILGLLILILILSVLVRLDVIPTGFSGKTIWDWLDVVGVPITVGVIALAVSVLTFKANQRAEAERELNTDRAREATLRAYLDQMTDLIVRQQLMESAYESPVRAVAHAQTLAALRSLNGPRKGILLQFLHDSNLIRRGETVIPLRLADLRGADLAGANLDGSDLSGANLSYADLYGANLSGADLRDAVVTDDQLVNASELSDATLPDGTKMTQERWDRMRE